MKLMGILAAGVSATMMIAGAASAATTITDTASQVLTASAGVGANITFNYIAKAATKGALAGDNWSYSLNNGPVVGISGGMKPGVITIDVPFTANTKLEIVQDQGEYLSGTTSIVAGAADPASVVLLDSSSAVVAGSATPWGVVATPFNIDAGSYVEQAVVTLSKPTAPFKNEEISIGATAQAVPEPAAWSLMLMGVGGIGAMMRRRRVAVAA